MTTHKDAIGQEIKVGDTVVITYGKGADLYKTKVAKLTPKRIFITSGSPLRPNQVVRIPNEYETVIRKSRLEQLEGDSQWLGALEEVGVENWSGYAEAQRLMV